ncbi:MAG: hypothetical protein CMF54_07290 [Legionellales bacterium]|nr:hypothetical protein [Legionellales bacterium]|tara:strand:- start:1504 stop:2370 length:867 start_codon:yes stop_codon:yes gene_type:complete
MFIIFGSSGFIGKKLDLSLKKKFGKDKVISIGRWSKKRKINLNKTIIFKEIPNRRYKCAFILSGKSNLIFKNRKKEIQQINENINIVKNIIKFCKLNNVKKIIFLSSSAVYSDTNSIPFNENECNNPKNSLGISKFVSENYLKKFSKRNSVKVNILRVFTVYGKGMKENQFLYQAIKKFKSKKKNLIFWNKEVIRNFVHVDDIVNIIIKFIDINMPKFAIYNVASNNSYTIKTVIKYLNEMTGYKKKIIFKENINNLSHKVNNNKIKKKLNLKFKDFKKELTKLYEKI